MDFLTKASLVNAGFSIAGTLVDNIAISKKANLETKANEISALSTKVEVAKQYNNLFEKQLSDLSVQKSILANLEIDKSSSFFGQALRKQEKAFLGSQKALGEDFSNIDSQKTLSNINIKMKKNKERTNSLIGLTGNLADIGFNYYSKKGGINGNK